MDLSSSASYWLSPSNNRCARFQSLFNFHYCWDMLWWWLSAHCRLLSLTPSPGGLEGMMGVEEKPAFQRPQAVIPGARTQPACQLGSLHPSVSGLVRWSSLGPPAPATSLRIHTLNCCQNYCWSRRPIMFSLLSHHKLIKKCSLWLRDNFEWRNEEKYFSSPDFKGTKEISPV